MEVLTASDVQQSWVFFLVGAVALFFITRYGSQLKKKFVNLPPGPRNWLLIGALREMKPGTQKAFVKLAEKYGPVVYFRLGVQDVVLVSSAEAAEELLAYNGKDAKFADRCAVMSKSMGKYMGFDYALLPFADYDDRLKLLRKIAAMEFFTGTKLKSYEDVRSREMAEMVEKIFNKCEPNSSNDVADKDYQTNSKTAPTVGIRDAAAAVIRNVMFLLCFGERFDSLPPTQHLQKFPQFLKARMKIFMKFNLVNYLPWLEWLDPQGSIKGYKDFDKVQRDFYGTIVEEHRRVRKLNHDDNNSYNDTHKENSRNNFVDFLLGVQEEGGEISDNAIMGIVSAMMSGSIDTTSTAIEWVLLELIRHPELFKRLQDEIDAIVGKKRAVDEADLQAMPFLKFIVMESLRLHPPIPFTFPHVNAQPSTLGGYSIPARTAVIVNIQSIGRDSKSWKDPSEFNPDRFMPSGSFAGTSLSKKSIKANGSNYHLLPFSSGRRACPGYNLAIVVVLRIVATLVHAFDWSLPSGKVASDLKVDGVGNFVFQPKSELLLTPRNRVSRHVYQTNISLS